MQTHNHHVGYSRENEFWFVRFYPYKTEQQAKDAVSTFTRPAAPVEGLETIGYVHRGTAALLMEGAVSKAVLVQKPGGDFKHPVVFAEQAEAIIAAIKADCRKVVEDYHTLATNASKRADDLEADNAALTARVKDLERINKTQATSAEVIFSAATNDAKKIRPLETQLAAARKGLAFYADVHKYPAPLTGGMGALWSDCGAIARAALSDAWTPTHQHKKRGSKYRLFGFGKMQSDSWVYPHHFVDMGENETEMRSVDMQEAAVYLEEDGTIWIRPIGEFNDGRFLQLD